MTAPTLRRRPALVVATVSAAALVLVLIAWTVWPDPTPRADLVATAPSTTTTTVPPATTVTTAPATTLPPTTTTTPPAAPRPSSLRIPAIGVDADVISVGLQADGQMEIPPAAQVGWYELGPAPGEGGSAVLAAHIDYAGERGAFFDLPGLAIGAEVEVIGPDGTPQRFVVTTREQVAKADVDLRQYFTNRGDPRLTLITCGGAFNSSVRHYEDNIIVTAVPV